MKLKDMIKASIAAFAVAAASSAMAEVITLNASNLPANGYLSAGTYQGSFNGAGLLPAAYTVNNLSFDFKFIDDGFDPFTPVPGAITSSDVLDVSNSPDHPGVKIATRITTYFVPVQSYGEAESARLTFGAVSFTGKTQAGQTVYGLPSTPAETQPVRTGNATIWIKGNGTDQRECTKAEVDARDRSCKELPYYTVTRTVTKTDTTDYTGSLNFTGSLLTSLFQNDKLDFTLDITGDLLLTKATLDVDFSDNTPAAGAAVPEPGSLALFGIALLGAIGATRKRRA